MRAADELRLYALERDDFIAAVTGHAPSLAAAESVVATRLPAWAPIRVAQRRYSPRVPGIRYGAGATEVLNRIHIIGSGRVGSAVSARLQRAWPGSSGGGRASELVLLCVPDTAIAEVAGV